MTLQLAVRITGDASGLNQAAREAQDAVRKITPPSPTPAPRSSPTPSPAPAPPPGLPPAFPGAVAAANSNLRPDQWKVLGYQINDVVTSLGSGASAMQVLSQQGGQVYQVLQDGKGGVSGVLKEIGTRTLGLLTPARLLAGGFLGVAAAAAVLGTNWARSQKEIELGLTGIGALSRATAADINRIAEAQAATGRMSTSTARGIATAIAGTGRVDVSNVGSVAGLAAGYSKLFGKDLDEAGADLARIFADPVKGSAELDARLGSLDDRTQRYIRTLVDQGRRQEAIQVMVRTFGPDLERAAEKTTLWGKAWASVASLADAAGAAAAKTVTSFPLEERLQAARRQVEDFRRARDPAANPAATAPQDEGRAQFLRERGYSEDMIRRLRTDRIAPPRPVAQRDMTRAEDNLEHLSEVSRRAGQGAYGGLRAKELADFSKQAGDALRSLQPEIAPVEELINKLKLLENVPSNPAALKVLGVTAQQATQGVNRLKGAIEGTMSAEEMARKSAELTIRSIEARTVAEKAAIAVERERLGMANQKIAPDERRRLEEEARQTVIAQSTRDSADRLRSANDSAAVAGLPSYQRQVAELEAKYRDIFLGSQVNPAALADDRAAKAAERRALDAQAIGGPMRDASRGLTEQAAALELQRRSFGLSTEAAERLAASQRMVNQFQREGVEIGPQLQKWIDDYATAYGKGAAATDEFLRKQREVVGALDDIRSGTRGAFTGVFNDLAQGKNVLDGLKNSLLGISSRLFERTVSAPLTDSLLGREGQAGGGLFGGALGGMFGKAAGLSTADITAGIVNVNGSVAGLAGGGGVTGGLGSTVAGAAGGGGGSAALSGPVPEQIWSFFKGKGLSDNAAAAMVAQAQAESGFRPDVVNSIGASGLFQHLGSRKTGLLDATGGNLRDVNAQLEYTWKELTTSERRALTGLAEAPDLRSAVRAGTSFERPEGFTWSNPEATHDFGKRMSYAEGALARFGGRPGLPDRVAAVETAPLAGLDAAVERVNTTATAATQGVTTLSTDLGALPASLTQASQGFDSLSRSIGSGGGGGGLLSALGLLRGGSGGGEIIAGTEWFAEGGRVVGRGTGTSDSNLVRVSAGEYIVNASATARHGPLLDALNDHRLPMFAEGGPVMPLPTARPLAGAGAAAAAPSAAGEASAPIVNIYNQEGGTVQAEVSRGPGGSTDIMIRALDRALADRAVKGNSAIERISSGAAGRRRG